MTDQELMEAVVAGNSGAADELVSRYGRRVFAYLVGWLKDLLIDRTRSRNFKLVAASLPFEDGPASAALSPHSDSPEHRAMRQEISVRVREAIETLPPRQREVVQLRLLAELSLEEIAQAVGLSLGGVKSTLHNALHNLRGRLADLQGDHYVHL
ncbi:MAG: sigma-70 family RNA polymerase sigma factor [Acidobacteriota bacterium]